MTNPAPLTPADRAAIAARVEAVQEFWGRGTWAGHSERVALETALITQDVPRLLAALAAAEAQGIRLMQESAHTRTRLERQIADYRAVAQQAEAERDAAQARADRAAAMVGRLVDLEGTDGDR